MSGGPRNALYNTQGGAFKACPLLLALSWAHIKVSELYHHPRTEAMVGTRYSGRTGMEEVSSCLSKGKALLWGKILHSHHLSLLATIPTSQSTVGPTNKRKSKPG